MTSVPTPAGRATHIHGFPMRHPADVAMLEQALADASIAAAGVVCVLVKTEGNGLDNDYTRVMATDAIGACLARAGADLAGVSLIASGGCEAFSTPHMTLFEVRSGASGAPPAGPPRLAVGRAVGAQMAPEAVGTLAQARATAHAVHHAMAHAGLRADEVAYVEVKAAILTPAHEEEARRRGAVLRAPPGHASKTVSRAASALGIALAIGEIDAAALTDDMVGTALDVYTARGCVTAGDLDLRNEVLVFGNSAGWAGNCQVASACLDDLLDARAIVQALRAAGLEGEPQLDDASRARLRAIMFKGEPSRTDTLRGERQVMWHDSDVHALRQMRAGMAGVIGALTGYTRVFIGGGAEHQGPEGGGTFAVFAECAPPTSR